MQSTHLERLRLCCRCAQDPSRWRASKRRSLHHVKALQRPGNGGTVDQNTVSHAKDISTRDNHRPEEEAELGPMSRRLEEATEETLLSGGVSGRRAIQDAGFSEELREKLLDKIATASFQQQQQQQQPASQLGTTSDAPWTGTENTVDAVLRMLQDAHKPLRPDHGVGFPPSAVVDTRLRRHRGLQGQSPGQRAVNARDRANMYVGMDMKTAKGLSADERAEMKAELRERFQPAARAVPATLSGIAALANQRIEDAVARGQFKDLPRGKALQRDPTADNPFIDTTEYIMNRMIRRQELVPPWIEKQQELTRAARVFRERLRNDWKRHAARMIASRGGSLEEQMRRAAAFAAAETRPPASSSSSPASPAPLPTQLPFRDPDWEKTEKAYMDLSIDNLNRITRSYNLMAPELARKPYFSLERELNACFADVAPLVAHEIKTRALGRRAATGAATGSNGSRNGLSGFVSRVLGKEDSVRIHVEGNEKAYGLREWWRDIWKRK
ncbi:hypothetical protein E4U43_005609 [Claviceps pusilla]|uniref:DnaJ homologue subfamily C member 28 conserved domain-containing protein n=1 Tax=Claviceps pusilla TaxID=123648 RepID=A0A9P7NEB3_9HYPO|nr:hypothetical protein E4U43_005609 [Claviceps pusilla]